MANGHDAERAYIQSRLDHQDSQFDAAIESMRTDIDRLRDTWAGWYAEQRQAYEDRVRQLQDDQARWLRSIYTDDAGSSAPTPERAQPEPVDAPPAGRSFPAGTAPAGHPDPWAAAKQAADDIKTMSMAEYAARRAALGVRSSTDMTRLVGG